MDWQGIRLTFAVFLSLIPWKKEDGLVNKESHLLLSCVKNQKIQQVEEDGFSINFVLSGISGSFPPLTLIFITMCIFIHTCVGVEMNSSQTTTELVFEDYKITSSDWSPFTLTKVLLDSSKFSFLYPVSAVVATVLLVLTGVACFAYCKKGCAENPEGEYPAISLCPEAQVHSSCGSSNDHNDPESIELTPAEVEQGQDPEDSTYLKKKNTVIHTLKEQKEELEEHRDQLIQQLKKTEEEKEENKIKLQEVENTPGLLNKKEDLFIIKWKLDGQQREYENFVLHVDQLLQTIDNVLVTVTE